MTEGVIVIRQSILLPYCWVCASSIALDEHHIVPRAYGGTRGPTVTLCGNHHKLIHDESFKPPDRRNFGKVTEEQHAKLMYLSNVIANARHAVKKLSRPMTKQITLGATQNRMLRMLKRLQGFKNEQDAIEFAIEVAFRQVAPLAYERKGNAQKRK